MGNSLPKALYTVASSEAAPPVDGDTETKAIPPEVPEEATQLAMKAAEAFLGSVDHNDIEGSQYQLVLCIYSVTHSSVVLSAVKHVKHSSVNLILILMCE